MKEGEKERKRLQQRKMKKEETTRQKRGRRKSRKIENMKFGFLITILYVYKISPNVSV